MAAISALMVNDTALRKEPFDEERTPTTPRPPTTILSSRPGTETTRDNQVDTSQAVEHELAQTSPNPTASDSHTHSSSSPNLANDDDKDRMDIDDDDQDGSDNDTEQGDSGSGSRKKKGQRFFCTGYPPCNLSFTRSEHLARHIRKHTGERPFQCHCNRRFSRLDNLRQHAQTVHVNEEIPTDSLAATGTRFQRQIRTDRVRPTGRPRSGTMSSTGTHSRGHSRNLSASSIGSTSSNYSTSTVDPRRRPPPILMADGRPKLGLETPSTPPPQFANFATHSPGDIGTPTSATYSIAPNSPSFGSSMGSPLTSTSRSGLFGGSRTPTRRLSVPSGPHPYHFPYPPPYLSPFSAQPGPPSAIASSNPSTITSPTSSTFPFPAPFGGPPGEDWRRRTWHPSTYSGLNLNYNRPATSGLSYSQTPDAPQPAFAPNATAAAGQAPRLPGIESFDHVQQRPTTPPRLNLSSSGREGQPHPSLMPPVEFDNHGYGHRRHLSADIPRQNRYTEANEQPDAATTASTWVQETLSQINQINPGTAKRKTDAPHHPMAPPPTTSGPQPQQIAHEASHLHASGNRSKRNGLPQPSIAAARTSPEDSASSDGVPTPGTSVADVHPAIMPSNGILESQHPVLSADGNQNQCLPPPQPLSTLYSNLRGHDRTMTHRRDGSFGELNRLEALVAVATSEKNATQTSQ